MTPLFPAGVTWLPDVIRLIYTDPQCSWIYQHPGHGDASYYETLCGQTVGRLFTRYCGKVPPSRWRLGVSVSVLGEWRVTQSRLWHWSGSTHVLSSGLITNLRTAAREHRGTWFDLWVDADWEGENPRRVTLS